MASLLGNNKGPERRIVTTGDGSKTLRIDAWNEAYHSVHGAVQEAYHVFIRSGLDQVSKASVNLLEIGFGTGLNAFVTLLEGERRHLKIHYLGVEAYPVTLSEWQALDYPGIVGRNDCLAHFTEMHTAPWEQEVAITPAFLLHKHRADFRDLRFQERFDLIYFDAFGARVQPELWTETIFETMASALVPGGILVTYAAKGSVRRAMQHAGLIVERLPGPPGKREMLRATKPVFIGLT